MSIFLIIYYNLNFFKMSIFLIIYYNLNFINIIHFNILLTLFIFLYKFFITKINFYSYIILRNKAFFFFFFILLKNKAFFFFFLLIYTY